MNGWNPRQAAHSYKSKEYSMVASVQDFGCYESI